MAYFQNAEVSFEVPDEWVDQTAVIYAERVKEGLPATVALVRTPMLANDTLKSRANAVARKVLAALPGAKILEENWLELDKIPTVQFLVEGKHPDGQIMQLITVFAREGTFWVFTATVPSDRLNDVDPILQEVLGSLKITAPAAAPER